MALYNRTNFPEFNRGGIEPPIELDQVSQPADYAALRLTRRGFVVLGLAMATGAAIAELVDSARAPAAVLAGLTDTERQQMRADAQKAAQEEFETAQAAQTLAKQYSSMFNNAMSQPYNVQNIMMLPGTVYNNSQGERLPVCRNPVFLGTPNQTAATLGEFMQGAYFGTLGPGAADALVEIVPSRLYDGMVYEPDDPKSSQFTTFVDVRVSAVGTKNFELMAVDDSNQPLIESDGISWKLLCVPIA